MCRKKQNKKNKTCVGGLMKITAKTVKRTFSNIIFHKSSIIAWYFPYGNRSSSRELDIGQHKETNKRCAWGENLHINKARVFSPQAQTLWIMYAPVCGDLDDQRAVVDHKVLGPARALTHSNHVHAVNLKQVEIRVNKSVWEIN